MTYRLRGVAYFICSRTHGVVYSLYHRPNGVVYCANCRPSYVICRAYHWFRYIIDNAYRMSRYIINSVYDRRSCWRNNAKRDAYCSSFRTFLDRAMAGVGRNFAVDFTMFLDSSNATSDRSSSRANQTANYC